MTVTEVKHAAKRQEWQERIMECRSSGEPVQRWCAEHQVCTTTYYRWEREIFGRFQKKEGMSKSLVAAGPEFTEISGTAQREAGGRVVMTVRIEGIAVDIYAGAGAGEIEAMCRALKQC